MWKLNRTAKSALLFIFIILLVTGGIYASQVREDRIAYKKMRDILNEERELLVNLGEEKPKKEEIVRRLHSYSSISKDKIEELSPKSKNLRKAKRHILKNLDYILETTTSTDSERTLRYFYLSLAEGRIAWRYLSLYRKNKKKNLESRNIRVLEEALKDLEQKINDLEDNLKIDLESVERERRLQELEQGLQELEQERIHREIIEGIDKELEKLQRQQEQREQEQRERERELEEWWQREREKKLEDPLYVSPPPP